MEEEKCPVFPKREAPVALAARRKELRWSAIDGSTQGGLSNLDSSILCMTRPREPLVVNLLERGLSHKPLTVWLVLWGAVV